MQSIAETCVRFDAAHLSINLVSEIALPMFPTLRKLCCYQPLSIKLLASEAVLTLSIVLSPT